MNYYAGLDIGSTTTKAVIIDQSGLELGKAIVATGISGSDASEEALFSALGNSSLAISDITSIVATGYGRALVTTANLQLTEITCHAAGAFAHIKHALALIDIGGQDSKAITVTDSGKVDRFIMNDRCAAGTGRFLEVMSRVLETDIKHLSAMALSAKKRADINNMCTVFAESEVISMLARKATAEDVAAGLIWGVAERVGGMLCKLTRGLTTVHISGGVALIPAVVAALAEYLSCEVLVLPEPQFNGAYGAALLARNKHTSL